MYWVFHADNPKKPNAIPFRSGWYTRSLHVASIPVGRRSAACGFRECMRVPVGACDCVSDSGCFVPIFSGCENVEIVFVVVVVDDVVFVIFHTIYTVYMYS